MRVILIGGSSHIGKSTLAEFLSIKLSGDRISTDSLARHPGRPWSQTKEVPKHVIEHYLSLSVEELIADVLRHYKSMQPRIASLIAERTIDRSAEPLILEGSALWPEFVSTLNFDNVVAVWLTASDRLFHERIYHASQIEERAIEEKLAIQKFLARTLIYNQKMMAAIDRLGLASVNVESTASVDELSNACLNLLKK